MALILTPEAERALAFWVNTFPEREFSGFGWVRINGKDLEIYDVILLDIGSYAYTEIKPEAFNFIPTRPDRLNMRVWFHKHPITGWSSLDNYTIRNEPLGQDPLNVKWSVSIVHTPRGWIGRLDTYGPGGKTVDLEVRTLVDARFQQMVDNVIKLKGKLPELNYGNSEVPLKKNLADSETEQVFDDDEYWEEDDEPEIEYGYEEDDDWEDDDDEEDGDEQQASWFMGWFPGR